MTENLPREVLKALVRGDMTEYLSLAERLDKATDEKARDVLHAGLLIEANGRWGSSPDMADIRAWVADLRNSVEQSIGDIDPVACEKVIVSVLTGDPDVMAGVHAGSITNLVALTTFALAQDSPMSDDQLEKFLDRAEYIATD